LQLLKEQGFKLTPDIRLIFENVHPYYRDESECPELARQHDQIVAVVKDYAAQSGLIIENAYFEPKEAKFQTEILIE
jgi:hypothetical protein|tara:strand:- start:83 stop:313 length:231 start_codon:yes stop_codon:yes gene_type:complete